MRVESDPADQPTISALGERRAQQAVDPGDAHVDDRRLRQLRRLGIDHAVVDDEVGAGEPEQLDEPGDGERHALRIDTPIETQRCFAAQTEPARRLGDADRLEPGDLQRDRAWWRR